MKKIISLLICGLLVFSLAACGGNAGQAVSDDDAVDTQDTSSEVGSNGENDTLADRTQNDDPAGSSGIIKEQAAESADADTPAGSNILVAYFSLADEQYEVGVIEKGNTQIIAEMIAEQTGADTFSIERTVAYPATYNGLLEISREEEREPPKIAGTVENMDDYDVIFIGYPIWWGNLPAIVTVFLESYDFSGKTVIPFCTHAGSGLSGTQGTVEKLCKGATVEDGLAVRGRTAQKERDSAEKAVTDWLRGLGYIE